MRKCSSCGRECQNNEYSCKECGGVTTNISQTKSRFVSPRESKEQIINDKLRNFMKSHGLESLEKTEAEIAKNIANQLMGNNLITLGTALSFGGKQEDVAKLTYLSALVEQNWMIINQLNKLNKSIDKILDK